MGILPKSPLIEGTTKLQIWRNNMAQEAVKTLCSNDKPDNNQQVEHLESTNKNTIVDLTTGQTMSAKQVRIRVSQEHSEAIELLKSVYGSQLGKDDITLSKVITGMMGVPDNKFRTNNSLNLL